MTDADPGAVRPTDESRRERWEQTFDWPLTAIAVAFLVAYAWPILEPGMPRRLLAGCLLLTWIAWGLFAIDFLARLGLSRNRRAFLSANVLDLAVVVLPLLRPLRALRLVRVLSVLNRAAGTSLRGRVAAYVVGSTTLILFVSSLAVFDAERGAKNANIKSFSDAVWWSFTTVTTVGYGDRFPVTGTGRLVAVGLMLAGIALLGVVTASFASWLIDRVSEEAEETQAATREDIEALAAEVRALRTELRRLSPNAAHPSASDLRAARKWAAGQAPGGRPLLITSRLRKA